VVPTYAYNWFYTVVPEWVNELMRDEMAILAICSGTSLRGYP
jgi:hypothetical protein